MFNARTLVVMALCSSAAAIPAAADPFIVPVSVSTSGVFSCVIVAPCIAGGNTVTIPSGAGTATVTFTGVNETFHLTNTSSQVTLGRFDVVASPGYTWPVASVNPDLSIFRFTLEAENPLNSITPQRLLWEFGPGGGVALMQRGWWNFGLQPDVPSPWPAANFTTNAPLLVVNQSTDITAEAGLVPEPTTMLMVGSGLAGLVARCRRRRGTTGR